MIIRIRRMNRGRSFHRIVVGRSCVDRVGGGGSGVDVHGVGMPLPSSSGWSTTVGMMVGVRACRRLIGLVHESVHRIEILMPPGSLRGPSLRGPRLRTTRGSVTALTLDSSGCHWLLI